MVEKRNESNDFKPVTGTKTNANTKKIDYIEKNVLACVLMFAI